jgi:flagella basal body P-ring formation protein FlgA
LLALCAALTLAVCAAAARAGASARDAGIDRVELRGVARVQPGRDVTLGDVAHVTGPRAEALRALVLVPARDLTDTSLTIDLARVRSAIDPRDARRIVIDGAACAVRVLSPAPAEPTPAVAAATDAPPAPGAPTVRDSVLAALRLAFDVPAEDIRVTLSDSGAEAALLSTPAQGRTVDARPTGLGDRVPVQVTVYEGDRVVASGLVRAGVLLRREVALASAGVARGEALTAANIHSDIAWTPPSADAVPLDAALGMVARRTLRAGQRLTRGDVESPVVVRRGDLVVVRSLAGAIVVRVEARALEDGRVGDVIRFQSERPAPPRRTPADRAQRTERTQRPEGRESVFTARVDAPGRAVVAPTTGPDAAGAPAQQPSPALELDRTPVAASDSVPAAAGPAAAGPATAAPADATASRASRLRSLPPVTAAAARDLRSTEPAR